MAIIYGTSGDDTIIGTDGDDEIYGLDGNDTLSGGPGSDYIVGGDGDDVVDGGAGDDRLYVSWGNDRLNGGDGDDFLSGMNGLGALPDLLNGGDGNDSIEAGYGDTVDGGAGLDSLSCVFFGVAAGITADLSTAVSGSPLNISGISVSSIEHIWSIIGTDYNDVLIAGPIASDTVFEGRGGDDILIGGAAANNLYGGYGNDTLRGGAGIDYLEGGPGNDTFIDTAAGLNGDYILDFTAGEDKIVITDASLETFTFSVSAGFPPTLTYNSAGVAGSVPLNYYPLPPGDFVAKAAAGGGVELTYQLHVPVPHAANDFNGDGCSDILWKHDDGTVRDWLGQRPNGNFVDNIDNVNILSDWSWHAVGTGDFNGDGCVDILWKNDNGTVRDWLGQTDGTFKGNIDKVNILSDWSWQAVGTGDFNGDGYDDILWQNDNGTVRQWLGQSDGSFLGNIAHVNFIPPAGMHLVGTGDFNGDGRSDILWQSDAGIVTDWLGKLDGSFIDNSSKANIEIATTWRVVGTGDFNGDKYDDILWRNDDGTIREWLGQDGGAFVDNVAHVNFIPAVGAQVIGIGDYNGDGRADLLWSNNGTVTQSLGQLDGSFADNSAYVNITTGTQWHAQDPSVHQFLDPGLGAWDY